MAIRLSVITYNIWVNERWAKREPALRKFLQIFEPDVLCLQELTRKSRAMIDDVLSGHDRVHDAFIGWTKESNIYWRRSMMSEIDHGAEKVDIRDSKDRRLFWVRLQLKTSKRSILVATAHLTHQRHPAELKTGASPRVAEIKRIIAHLKRLNRKREPLFFMGDMNDPVLPQVLLHEAGYVSCFAALGIVPPPTFKAYPTANVAPGKPIIHEPVDWLVANAEARAIAAAVPQFYLDDAAPSDHWPVQAVYEIE